MPSTWRPDPSLAGAALGSLLGPRPFRHLAVTGSTNDDAWVAAEAGAPAGFVVLADAQEAGRGRLGRSWFSPPGENLYFSLVLRPGLAPPEAPLLCLAAAVALAEETGQHIKWPNDLVDAQDRKLAGLLAEMDIRGDTVRFVVLGVGLNVNQDTFPGDIPNPASLRQVTGRPWDRLALLARLLPAIEARAAQVTLDRAALLDAWRARSRTLGRQVRVGAVEGVAEDVRADGALLVRTPAGVEPIVAGDVELLSPRPSP